MQLVENLAVNPDMLTHGTGRANARCPRMGERKMAQKLAADRVRIKRAYEPVADDDGARILIDRLWPRGIKKEDLKLSDWKKELSPSTELRKWFGHDPKLWDEFQERYKAELAEHADVLQSLRDRAQKETVCIVYGAKDEEHNNAVVVRDVLLRPEHLPDAS